MSINTTTATTAKMYMFFLKTLNKQTTLLDKKSSWMKGLVRGTTTKNG